MLKDQKRWKLFRDFKKGKYCFLIGVDNWSIELQKSEWSLRLVFESQEQTRSFEMYWPIPIAQNLFYEIKNMWESMD